MRRSSAGSAPSTSIAYSKYGTRSRGSDMMALRVERATMGDRSGHSVHAPESHDEMVKSVAETIAATLPAALRDNPYDLRVAVASSLQLHQGPAHRFQPHARESLRLLCATVAEEDRIRMLQSIGSTAERARLLAALHATCPGSPQPPVQAAQMAFRALEAAPFGEDASGPHIAIALWVLGRWMAESHLSSHTQRMIQGRSKEQRRHSAEELSGHNRWPAHIEERRFKDLKELLVDFPWAIAAYRELMASAATAPATVGQLLSFHLSWLERSSKCYCDNSEAISAALFSENIPVAWLHWDGSAERQTLLENLNKAAQPDRAIYRAGAHVLTCGPERLSHAFLGAALYLADDKRCSAWQEKNLGVEATRTFSSGGRAFSRIAWTETPGNVTTHMGELDAIAFVDRSCFAFQAKAPRSLTFRNRQSPTQTAAQQQHEEFADALIRGVYLIRRDPRPHLLLSEQVRMTDQVRILIPITVGIEASREYGVGASKKSGFARVYTTLDHLRLVSSLVPKPFRAAYWLDRYVVECSDHLWVDEIDFFGTWYDFLCGREQMLTGFDTYLMSKANRVEKYVTLCNSLAFTNSAPARQLIDEARRELRDGSPELTSPLLMAALNGVTASRSPGWLFVASALVEANFRQAEDSMRRKSNFSLSTRYGCVGVVWDVGREGLSELRSPRGARLDAALYRFKSEWRVWLRNPWHSNFNQGVESGAITVFPSLRT